MFIAFLLIIAAGLGWIAFILTDGFRVFFATEKVSLKRPGPADEGIVQGHGPSQADLSADPPVRDVELKVMEQSWQLRVQKLEEMILEKNKVIEQLQQGLKADHDHQGQIDQIKGIFQAQIDELKHHNKQLKDDLARLSDENLDLQTRLYAARPAGTVGPQEIRVEPAGSPQQDQGQASPLSLRDVFGEEEKDGTVNQ